MDNVGQPPRHKATVIIRKPRINTKFRALLRYIHVHILSSFVFASDLVSVSLLICTGSVVVGFINYNYESWKSKIYLLEEEDEDDDDDDEEA